MESAHQLSFRPDCNNAAEVTSLILRTALSAISFVKFRDPAAVCPCVGDRNRRHNAVAHVLYEAAQEANFRPEKQKAGRHHTRLDTDGIHQPASPDCPAGKDAAPGACDLAIISLFPVARSDGSTTPAIRSLSYYVTSERTLHDTAKRCHHKGIRFVSVIFDGHAGGWRDSARNWVSWISHGLGSTSRAPLTTSVVIWISALTPRAPF